jgi:hypothetical protein
VSILPIGSLARIDEGVEVWQPRSSAKIFGEGDENRFLTIIRSDSQTVRQGPNGLYIIYLKRIVLIVRFLSRNSPLI